MSADRLAPSLLLIIVLASAATAGSDSQPVNLLCNGDFELCAKPGGVPDGWDFSGDPKFVKATLSQDAGPDGRKSIRLDCTRHEPGSGWSHAMLCQVGHVAVKQDHKYHVSFLARGKDIRDFNVQVALQNTKPWQPLGLRQWFTPTDKWQRYDFEFVATQTCAENTRFQLSFNSTGLLWIANASVVEGPTVFGDGPSHPTHLYRPTGDGNLIANASFECGPVDWGSQTANYITWATPMDRLFGQVVEGEAFDGCRCLKIELTAASQPVVNFDCYQPLRVPVRAPLAGSIGYVALEPDQPYVLSAYLRAAEESTPARLGVQQFGQWANSTRLAVGRKWKRYAFTFKAKGNACYALVGPDLLDSDRKGCTLWIDAVQLEKGTQPKAFSPRSPVELGVRASRQGNVYFEGDRPAVIVSAANAGKAQAVVEVHLGITDFWDQAAGNKQVRLTVPAGGIEQASVDLGLTKLGYFRIRSVVDGRALPQAVRLAVIRKYPHRDSIFGINHAYGWPELIEAGTWAGILWARDWSMSWQNVEPEKAEFAFVDTDYQVDRAMKLGQSVLGLLPFPSSEWSSSAPVPTTAPDKSRPSYERQAYPPRDIQEFKTYVHQCVAHCRGRIQWWQVFNEPLYTQYSLPRNKGFTPADYVKLVQAFQEAARAADKDCRVLAGPGGWTTGSGNDLKAMFEAGMLKYCDAVDLHIYPGYMAPEYLEGDLVRIRQLMDRYGQRSPLWLTEHGYYADDDLNVLPPDRTRFPQEILTSERQQAELSMRFNLILLANGVEKIFYHAGTAEGLNRDQIQGIFFCYGGEPRKIYPALAAMANLFPPGVRFVKDVSPKGGRQKGLVFEDGRRLILAAWQPGADKPGRLAATGQALQVRDMVGNPIEGGKTSLSTSPVLVVSEGLALPELEKAVEFQEAE